MKYLAPFLGILIPMALLATPSCAITPQPAKLMPIKEIEEYCSLNSDVKIAYLKQGSGSTPVVFVHGFGANAANWHPIATLLMGSECTTYSIDLKGCGLSSKPKGKGYSIIDEASVLSGFLDSLNLEGVIVVAHSLGGGIALRSATDEISSDRKRIRHLLLIDPAAFLTKLPFFVAPLRNKVLGPALLHLTTPEWRAEHTLRRIVYDPSIITDELVARYCRGARTPGATEALLMTAKEIIPDNVAAFTSAYSRLDIPVTIIWGENDNVLHLESGRELNRIIPQSSLTILPSCGHNPHEEHPSVVVGILRNIVKRPDIPCKP